jgi:hypothetical protein
MNESITSSQANTNPDRMDGLELNELVNDSPNMLGQMHCVSMVVIDEVLVA